MAGRNQQGSYTHLTSYQNGMKAGEYKHQTQSSKNIVNPYVRGSISYKAFKAGIQAFNRTIGADQSSDDPNPQHTLAV